MLKVSEAKVVHASSECDGTSSHLCNGNYDAHFLLRLVCVTAHSIKPTAGGVWLSV